jgi:hypothetical protein
MIQELENRVILVHEKKISSINSILPVLELVVRVSHLHLVHAILSGFYLLYANFMCLPVPECLVFFRIKGHC